MINKNKFYNKLEKSIFHIYERLLTEVSEANNQSSIDDIEIKLDVIMDALGLKDDEEDKKENKVEIADIDVETTSPEEEINTDNEISFVEDEENNQI